MKSILVLCAAATMATAGAETRVQVSSAMSGLMYNTKNACGGNFNNCASRKCYSLSVGNQVFVRDMHPSQESWNVYKVADWKSFKPDDQAGPQAEHPGHTLLAARSTNPTPLLVSFKDPKDGSGNVIIRDCEYLYGKPEWGANEQGRFFMMSACAKTEDKWEAQTCSAAPKKGASTHVGWYWAKKDLRTQLPATELKNRMTWTVYEVSPGVYKFKNVMRQMWLGAKPWGITLEPSYAAGASIKLDEAPAPNVVHPTPAPSACCTAAGCNCAISRTLGFGDHAKDDYDNTGRTRNDSEETTAMWIWSKGTWAPHSKPITLTEVYTEGGEKKQDAWVQGIGAVSGSSSTIELGYSRDCQFIYNADDDYCYLADGVTKSETTGQFDDLRLLKTAALRFTDLKIPAGATITSAKIEFTARSSDSSSGVSMTISGEQTSGGNLPYVSTPLKGSWTEAPGGLWMPKGTNLEDRLAASTYPTVAWNNIEPWKKNQKYSTPDLTKLVQAMVDNNVHRDALAFFIKDNGSTPFGKRRRAKSFKKGDPARLVLTFSTAPAIGDVYFNNGAKPLCQVDASGRTIVSYQSGNPAHMHFKCTHANGKCTCTDHPTHAAGNCKQFDHKGQTHTINGDCEDQCKGSPCGSNGTCQDGDSTYTCTCKNGFTGRNCQTAPPRTSCGGMSGADSTMCSGQQILESRPDSGCRGTSKCGVKNAAECRELCGANNAKCAFFSAYCNMGHPNCQRGLHSCTCYTGNRVGGCRGCTARISFAAQCN